MLSKEAYTKWAEGFALANGLRWDDAWEMVLRWYDSLARYDLAELEYAERAIARSQQPAPRDKSDYRGWVHRLVHEYRAEAYRQGPADDRGTCLTCAGSGMVAVPHPRCVRDGRWVPIRACEGLPPQYQMLAVYCSCPLGRWKHQRFEPRGGTSWRPLTLEEYDRTNPHWKRQVAARHAEELAEARQQVVEGRGPDAEGMRRLVRTLLERFRVREPGDGGD